MCLNELRQLWGPFTGKYFDKCTLSEKHKIPVENCCLLGYKFYMTVTCNETTTQKTLFSISSGSQFFLHMI